MYYRDRRVKYIREYRAGRNFYYKPIPEYLPPAFLNGIASGDISTLTDPMEIFVAAWISDKTDLDGLISLIGNLEPHHNRYSFHNYIFIPLVLFCLIGLYNSVQARELEDVDSIKDELANESGVENV